MQASLILAYGFEEHDDKGHLTAQFEGEHFMVGYHYISTVAQWPQFDLGGFRISIHPDDLEHLRGKTLILRKLNVSRDSSPHAFPAILVTA